MTRQQATEKFVALVREWLDWATEDNWIQGHYGHRDKRCCASGYAREGIIESDGRGAWLLVDNGVLYDVADANDGAENLEAAKARVRRILPV